MVRARAVILAAAAAALALPASASSTADFPVSTSLGGCSDGACWISVEFDRVDEAQSYTAIVRTPDGESSPADELDPGASRISVPYTGNGTYTVVVTAWGEGAAQAAGARPAR